MKRYSPYDHMVEHEDGEYIELAEYEALKAKHAKLVEAAKRMERCFRPDGMVIQRHQAIERLAKLREALAESEDE